MTKSIDDQVNESLNVMAEFTKEMNYATQMYEEGQKFERKRILDLLRSEEAMHSGINRDGNIEHTLKSKPVGPWIMSAKLWADWLQQKLK